MKVSIVGGGTAGWMTAAYLSSKTDWSIEVIASQDIPIIGVGESTLPSLHNFITECGLTEKDLETDCNTVRKFTIHHKNWTVNGESWWHDLEHGHAYHVDANRFGIMLRDRVALPNGVVYTKKTLNSIDEVKADYIIDCSGFSDLFPKHNYIKSSIINNKAVVGPSYDNMVKTYTETTALSAGWMWNIFLQNRIGNGYVYSDKFISDGEAKDEFLKACPYTLDIEKIRTISWESKYTSTPWRGNIISVGLSAGFLEPLEAQAIWLIQYQIEMIARLAFKKDSNKIFNRQWCKIVDHIEKFILLHYTASDRKDTPYWQYWNDVKSVSVPNTSFEIFGKHSYTQLAKGYNLDVV